MKQALATDKRPTLYIIAGHNGAGKSSIGPSLLPYEAEKLSVFDGDQAIVDAFREAMKTTSFTELADNISLRLAGEKFINLYEQALGAHKDFAYEGHFTENSRFELIQKFKTAGYQTNMIFLGLDTLEQSIERVTQRAALGGHDVPSWIVNYNYENNPKYIDQHLKLLDRLSIYNTSQREATPLLLYEQGQLRFKAPATPQWLQQHMPILSALPLIQQQMPERRISRKERDKGQDLEL